MVPKVLEPLKFYCISQFLHPAPNSKCERQSIKTATKSKQSSRASKGGISWLLGCPKYGTNRLGTMKPGSSQSLLLLFLGLAALWDSISVYIGPSPREREKAERKDRGE